MQSQKQQNDLCFQGKPFNITVIQFYAPTSNAEEAEVEWFYEDLQDLFRTNTQKRYSFHYRVQFSSVVQSCLTLCDPIHRSTPGLPVHHQLKGYESEQTPEDSEGQGSLAC